MVILGQWQCAVLMYVNPPTRQAHIRGQTMFFIKQTPQPNPYSTKLCSCHAPTSSSTIKCTNKRTSIVSELSRGQRFGWRVYLAPQGGYVSKRNSHYWKFETVSQLFFQTEYSAGITICLCNELLRLSQDFLDCLQGDRKCLLAFGWFVAGLAQQWLWTSSPMRWPNKFLMCYSFRFSHTRWMNEKQSSLGPIDSKFIPFQSRYLSRLL